MRVDPGGGVDVTVGLATVAREIEVPEGARGWPWCRPANQGVFRAHGLPRRKEYARSVMELNRSRSWVRKAIEMIRPGRPAPDPAGGFFDW